MKTFLSRRAALRTMTAGATVATIASQLSRRVQAAEAAADLKGRVNHSVCRWCYRQVPLEDLGKAAREMGLRSIELLELKEIPVVQKYGLTCAMVSGIPGGIRQGLNRTENHDRIVAWFEETAPKVAALGCRNIICFSGDRAG